MTTWQDSSPARVNSQGLGPVAGRSGRRACTHAEDFRARLMARCVGSARARTRTGTDQTVIDVPAAHEEHAARHGTFLPDSSAADTLIFSRLVSSVRTGAVREALDILCGRRWLPPAATHTWT